MSKFVDKTWRVINIMTYCLFVHLPKKTFKEIKVLFHRDASIYIQWLSRPMFDEVGNKYLVDIPDTFKINIDTGKKRRTIWLAADFEDAEELLKLLDDESNTGVDLQVGSTISSSIFIPRWAKKQLADELRPHIKYYYHLSKPYEKRGEA